MTVNEPASAADWLDDSFLESQSLLNTESRAVVAPTTVASGRDTLPGGSREQKSSAVTVLKPSSSTVSPERTNRCSSSNRVAPPQRPGQQPAAAAKSRLNRSDLLCLQPDLSESLGKRTPHDNHIDHIIRMFSQ